MVTRHHCTLASNTVQAKLSIAVMCERVLGVFKPPQANVPLPFCVSASPLKGCSARNLHREIAQLQVRNAFVWYQKLREVLHRFS